MKILLVEDDPDDLALARIELERLGHEVVGAGDAGEALRLMPRERPDLVVTDIRMPGMDGFDLTRAVQRLTAPRWQPVIFLTGHRDEALEVKALATGADGYIVKPASAEVLGARLQVIERLLAMQRQAEDHAAELERYHAEDEEEKRIAEHLLRRMTSRDKLDDPAVRHWISPAAFYSGELLAAARTPGNALHVLLADGSGRGLAASINVLPIIAPFYRMTEKGFGIDAIVREMNAKVRDFLPENRFVAATVASIDFREGYVRVWNGGNPQPFMAAPDGSIEHVFALRHLPLGVLDDEELDAAAETHALSGDGRQLMLYSDGLVEAENAAGEMFGFARFAAALGAAPTERLPALLEALRAHAGDAPPCDDIAVLAVDCHREHAESGAPPGGVLATPPIAGAWRFGLRLDGRELRKVDVVPLLLGLINQFEGTEEQAGQLFVILSELFNNALDHGLLRLDSRLKLDPSGMERYLQDRQKRLEEVAEGEIELEIEQFTLSDRTWLRIVCRDSGPGFDHVAVMGGAAAGGDQPFGRGLALVRRIATGFQFNEAGNVATAMLALSPRGPAEI